MDSAIDDVPDSGGAVVLKSDFLNDRLPSASAAPSALHFAKTTRETGVLTRWTSSLATGGSRAPDTHAGETDADAIKC